MKKELIDFAKWLNEKQAAILWIEPELYVERYLKSINSDALTESPDVNENEAKKKKCSLYYDCNNPLKDRFCYQREKNIKTCFM